MCLERWLHVRAVIILWMWYDEDKKKMVLCLGNNRGDQN